MSDEYFFIRPCEKHPSCEAKWIKVYNYYCKNAKTDFKWVMPNLESRSICPKCVEEWFKDNPNFKRAIDKLEMTS